MGSRLRKEIMPRVRESRFIVQPSSAESFGHSTMTHPDCCQPCFRVYAVALGDEAFQG